MTLNWYNMRDFSKPTGTIPNSLCLHLFVQRTFFTAGFPLSLCPGAGPAMLLPVLLGSLTGFAVLGTAFMGLWLHHRQKAKPSRCPPLGEFHGL